MLTYPAQYDERSTEGSLSLIAKSLFQAEDAVTKNYKAKFDEILHEWPFKQY